MQKYKIIAYIFLKKTGHSEAANERAKSPNKLMSSPKKTARMSPKKSPKKKSKKESAAATTKEVKNEKALFSMNPKSISNDQIAKWIKAGDVDKMELTVLMGKGNISIS